MQFRIQNAFFPCNCHFYEQFLTDPPIKWDYGYYISIKPKTWSHTLPKLKLPRNDPENAMHINLFSYKTNAITLISGIKHQIWLCQMCLTMFLQKDRKESVRKDSISSYQQERQFSWFTLLGVSAALVCPGDQWFQKGFPVDALGPVGVGQWCGQCESWAATPAHPHCSPRRSLHLPQPAWNRDPHPQNKNTTNRGVI